ncbi:MAG TPA: SGNH/GDSL hydrolase family protein [Microbacterium sp.]|nr:SGNH/GDSL hydrolase family protein [Microbacterium sp.]
MIDAMLPRRRTTLLAAAVLAVAGLALASVVAAPAPSANASISIGKPDKPGKPPGGGGGGTTQLAYAALGDSYAAGTGARSYLDTSCYRSSLGYPKLLDADANLLLAAFPACSGASTVEVIGGQVPAIPVTATRITLTVGGNDVGFAAVMQNCFVFVSSSCLGHIENGERMVADGVVAQRITSTVAAIRAKAAPGAKIVVTGYPLLFNLPNAKYSTWAGRVNGDTVALNDAIQAAAVASGAVFVDVEAAFAGHGIGSSSPWINDFNIFRSTDGFHPNATGYAAYATEIRKVIG